MGASLSAAGPQQGESKSHGKDALPPLGIQRHQGVGDLPGHHDVRRRRPSDAEARRIIDHAARAAASTSSTRPTSTADGRSESVIGAAIKAKRDRWVLATKVAQQGRSRPSTTAACRGATSCMPSMPASSGCRPITSTSTTFTASTPIRPGSRRSFDLRRPDPRRARSATGGCPTCTPGTSRTCTIFAGSWRAAAGARCSPTTI